MESRRSLRTTMGIRCRIARSRDSFLVVGAEPIYSLLLRALATGAVLLDALTRRRGVPLQFAGRAGRQREPGEWSASAPRCVATWTGPVSCRDWYATSIRRSLLTTTHLLPLGRTQAC